LLNKLSQAAIELNFRFADAPVRELDDVTV